MKSEKAVVFGVVQRSADGKTRVRAETVSSTRSHVVVPRMLDNVAIGLTVYSDATLSYQALASCGFEHLIIDHAVKYVRRPRDDEPH